MSETETASVKGRDITVKKLNDTQMMLLVREAKILQSDHYDQDRKLAAIGNMMDILESVVAEGEDRDWLMGLAGKGELSLSDLMGIATPEANTETAKPVRRATRARK